MPLKKEYCPFLSISRDRFSLFCRLFTLKLVLRVLSQKRATFVAQPPELSSGHSVNGSLTIAKYFPHIYFFFVLPFFVFHQNRLAGRRAARFQSLRVRRRLKSGTVGVESDKAELVWIVPVFPCRFAGGL